MPNRNYINGAEKERRIARKLKSEGWDIAQRSAGSHSPIDVFAVHKEKRLVRFIQAKPKSLSENKKRQLEEEHEWLNDEFVCTFEVI